MRFSKYETAKELWEAILKTFGGNEATKKTKKNQLKQQYGNFKAEGSETLEQNFNRLQAIVSHLEFMDVPIEQDDLNQKFLSSLALEWLVYTIVWRNIDDLDTMSLDDVYNHLKVYEPEVQKNAGANSQNMAFISSSNTNSGKISTASITTPYTRRIRAPRGIIIESSQTTIVPIISAKRKGNEKMVEFESTKKKKVQEQLDAQVAKELEYEFAREEQLIREQGKKDAEIARAQAERELGIMVAELDRSNKLIAKYMNEYEQTEADLSLEEKMELITKLIKYQRNLAEIKRYQAQQSKPTTKTEKINYYISILKSNTGWKGKDFRVMTFEQIEEKFIPVWKQIQDFVPMNSKLESSEPSQEQQTKDPKELSEEELKKMMEIVHVEEVYIEALHAKYPIIDWEIFYEEQRKEDFDRLWSLVKKTFSTTDPTKDKEKELWVELKRLYEPDPRDQLWALQKYMHDPLEWRLYDTCGVHHVSTRRGQEIFILVEKDYPLSKGLTTMMLCNKLQVD
ncbi:hypothetical protein Tco_1311890 [Tanacetum coccineum]